jgi:hypothetical protein
VFITKYTTLIQSNETRGCFYYKCATCFDPMYDMPEDDLNTG